MSGGSGRPPATELACAEDTGAAAPAVAGAPVPPDEHARLLDLTEYDILDAENDLALGRITRLAARLLDVPVAILNFVDRHRQWGTALIGLDSTEAPREHSFCAWAIGDTAPMLVPDARLDPRFVDNPMVTGDPQIRLYAGAPLRTPAGRQIGTLCVVDRVPRTLSAEDLGALQDLAALAVDVLELRKKQRAAPQPRAFSGPPPGGRDRHAALLAAVEAGLQRQPGGAGALHAAALLHGAVAADWSGLVRFGDGVRVQTARARPRLQPSPERLESHLQAGGALAQELRALRRPLYRDSYALHPDVAPFAPDMSSRVQSAAWLPLRPGSEAAVLWVFLRLTGPTDRSWSAPDRALLEAAARLAAPALAADGR